MKKNNIVKLVSFRNNDKRFNESKPRSKELRKWVKLGNHELLFNKLISESEDIISHISHNNYEYKDFPVIVEATLHPNAKAKEYRNKVNEFFIGKSFDKSVGLKNDNKMLYSLTKNDVLQIPNKLKKAKEDLTLISTIKDIKKYNPSVNRKIGKDKKIKIKLFDQKNLELNFEEEKILYNKLEFYKVNKLFYPNGVIAYEVENSLDSITFDALCELPFIDSIDEMPEFVYKKNSFIEDDTNILSSQDYEIDNDILSNIDEEKLPIVGLFDSGIEKEALFGHAEEGYTLYSKDELDISHGTKVGSLICFGDYLNDEKLGLGKCKIMSCIAQPKEKISDYRVLLNLKQALKKYSSFIKIWNLSLSMEQEISNESFSDFATNLDALQKEFDVLFIKSAGNCEELKNGKIYCGAESMRALTIGSTAQNDTDLSLTNNISPFSRTGPGPFNIVKPDLVYYGGNISSIRKPVGINTFDDGGALAKVIGTSFSTPRVSALAAHIHKNLPGNFNPLLIKGLLIHNAYYPNINIKDDANVKAKYGYGMPSSLNDIFFEPDNQVTMIFEGTIEKGEFVETLDIPYPKKLVDKDNYFKGTIKLTSIIDPILIPEQGLEYCQSDLNILFGTYQKKALREGPRVKNELVAESAFNLLTKDIFSNKKLSSNEEQALREKGKYSSIKKYIIDLEKIKDGKTKEKIKSDRLWYLRLIPGYHNYVENTLKKEEIKTKYCILITFIANENTFINTDVTNELESLGYNPIDINSNISNTLKV